MRSKQAVIKRRFSIASAKVLLFFELAKFLSRKMQKNVKKAKNNTKMHNFSLIFWRNEIFSVTLSPIWGTSSGRTINGAQAPLKKMG